MNVEQAAYSSLQNAFKNTGVYSLSITLSGSLAAGEEKTFTKTVTLPEAQDFVFAIGYYAEYAKAAYGDTTKYWQTLPTFDAYINDGVAGTNFYVYTKVNGNDVTFIAGLFNVYGFGVNLTTTTIDIQYVTYTVDT